MEKRLKNIILEHSDEIIKKWLEKLDQSKIAEYGETISQESIEQTNREFVNVIFSNIESDGGTDDLHEFSEKIVNLGWPLGYLTEGMQAFRSVTIKVILEDIGETNSNDEFLSIMEGVNDWVDPIKNRLINEYSHNWTNIVSLQKVALQELSAPLIPVMEGITVMPLVGTIDTDRAKLIMENLLNGVIKNHAEVVLIDITGVPVVDTMVAHHIIQAAEAVRLVGSQCILVGIRPEIAQTIVNLGIDLRNFPTKSSLQKGFRTALEMTGAKVVSESESEGDEIENILNSIEKE
ncbi:MULTISPECIES: STAS domain-containing protein [Allobacillus]|uniref:STAS domain-containing protein n=1 Tax=Allobacillus halotolerans TaxID=570278 RepID=A0ABS6GSA9_9BACI|nr:MULTISPECIES: STAS domain-containing protein [Allobacillus]MBU6082007.1 STAS domain-containing protein [Allobacillus halotolerans]TSJ66652.1 STAS domain-containing protein [Allobacillus sp. SKP2-8]